MSSILITRSDKKYMEKNENQTETLVLNLPAVLQDKAAVMAFAGIFCLAFFVPFLLGGPQWLVGTMVNTCLFLAVLFLPKKYYLPIVIFPSLGVLARGLIFGPFTPFLVYFLPFIWLGNFILMFVFGKICEFLIKRDPTSFNLDKLFSKFLEVGSLIAFPALAKFTVLFFAANIYFKFNFVPKIFLATMGMNQLLTAVYGGIIAYLIFIGLNKFYEKYFAGVKRIS